MVFIVISPLFMLAILQEIITKLSYQVQIMKQEQQIPSISLRPQNPLKRLNLLLQIQSFTSQLPIVQRTIILYGTYSSLRDISLGNLHTMAILLIDPTTCVKVDTKKICKERYVYSVLDCTEPVKKSHFDIYEEKEQVLQNVSIYESKVESLRVIVVPLAKKLIDVKAAQNFLSQAEARHREKKADIRNRGLNGEEREQAEQQVSKWFKNIRAEFAESESYKYTNIFRIEALLLNMLKLTTTVSLACLSEYGNKDSHKAQQELSKYFLIPKGMLTQTIIHSFYKEESEESQDEDEKKEKEKELSSLQQESVSTIFSVSNINDRRQLVHQKTDFKDSRYFWDLSKPGSFRARILQTIKNSNNQNSAFNDFSKKLTDTSRDITIQVFTIFGSFITQSLRQIGRPSNQLYPSIHQVIDKYQLRQLKMPLADTIRPYLIAGPQRDALSTLKLTEQKEDTPFVPESIKHLSFVFFFEKISQHFLDACKNRSQVQGSQEEVMLPEWNKFNTDMLSLCFSFTSTFHISQVDIELVHNFFCFLMASSQTITAITGQKAALNSFLRTELTKMKPSKQLAYKYIQDNESKIRRDEQINYYNILLAIVRQNRGSQQLKNQLKYLECYLLGLKAFCIATCYIHDESQIVEAIKSYAHICLKYPSFNFQKRYLIDIIDVQKKMAKLLRIVNQEDKAIEVYFKNRMVGMANKTCMFVRRSLYGDQKAKKLIQWGAKFERELEYDLAMGYYRDAYQSAKSIELAKEAVSKKVQCNQNRKKDESSEVIRGFNNFISSQDSSLTAFTSQVDLKPTYLKLRNQLAWNEDTQQSYFKPEGEVCQPEDLPMLSSIIR